MRGNRRIQAWAAVAVVAWLAVIGAVAVARQEQTARIPSGPDVRVSDGWYHLAECSIAQGRAAPSMALADALRKTFGPRPICEPLTHDPEWAAFVAAHADAIREELRLKAEAEAAEAKRKAEEEEAARVKRLADIEAERVRAESAPAVRLVETEARRMAEEAAVEAAGDPARFQTRFRALARAASPGYGGPQVVYGSPAIRITVAGPVARFEAAVMGQLQRRQPPEGAAWDANVAVTVSPEQAEAPDVRQVVVQRTDAVQAVGAERPATVLSSTLAPRRMPGEPVTFRHAGEVVFPLSAFEPGAGVVVRVIAVPAAGAPLSRTFNAAALRGVQ